MRSGLQFQFDDLGDLLLVQAAEDHDAIERLMNSGRKVFFSASITLDFMLSYSCSRFSGSSRVMAKPSLLAPLNHLCADVARHQHQRVAEIDAPALGIGQVAVFHDLQQHVERFWDAPFRLSSSKSRCMGGGASLR
jgi:hypothetical protein